MERWSLANKTCKAVTIERDYTQYPAQDMHAVRNGEDIYLGWGFLEFKDTNTYAKGKMIDQGIHDWWRDLIRKTVGMKPLPYICSRKSNEG